MFKPLALVSLSLLCLSTSAIANQIHQPPKAAQRVISLAPSATELAFSAGLGDKLLAVSEYSDYPQQASNLERVANYKSINIERIITLKPDLILAWRAGNPQKPSRAARSSGIQHLLHRQHNP
ncbi:vitamin B12 ABC transporter B12-binding component BtuF [Vibrio astriarenae]|nr:vitamin B12 ABC transporter B12-binding component BtuF [Vibrio sp. C7]